MGASLSHVRHHVHRCLVRVVLRILCLVSSPVNRLVNRLASSPGIPISNPSQSYWLKDPSPISKHGSGPDVAIPEYTDIVIIGSGITGTSIARALLDYDVNNRGSKRPLQIVMLEARDACSGATGRNGGHITPVLYQEYSELKRQYGQQVAAQIIRFRLSHLTELLSIATEEDLLEDSQCRETESYDVYQDINLYRYAKQLLQTYMEDLPMESSDFRIIEDKETLAELQLAPSVVGCLVSRGGAIHPYRFVTGILSRLLHCYPSSFQLFTHTPCVNILGPTSPDSLYTVHTPKGNIRARHVIHATNAWASHLLPGMQKKIIPARGLMTAQLPRTGLGKVGKSDWRGMRSFVLYPGSNFFCFDYLTQQPSALQVKKSKEVSTAYPPSSAELMLGGGFMRDKAYLTELANADDSGWNRKVEGYLSKALGDYFHTGKAGEKEKEKEKMIKVWSGILAISADERPWVGRVTESMSLRSNVRGECSDSPNETVLLAPSGEWLAAGYSGEGMVHAWLSGKAVASMLVGEGVGGYLPEVFKITEERFERACVEEFIGSALW